MTIIILNFFAFLVGLGALYFCISKPKPKVSCTHTREMDLADGSIDRRFIKNWEEAVGANDKEPVIDNQTLPQECIDGFKERNSTPEMKAFYDKYRSAKSIEEKAAYVLSDCIKRASELCMVMPRYKGPGSEQGEFIFEHSAGNAFDFIRGECKASSNENRFI